MWNEYQRSVTLYDENPPTDNQLERMINADQEPKTPVPQVDCKQSWLDGYIDKIQEILDYVGWIPFTIGDIADALNALIYFMRGNTLMGIINIVCLALPAALMAGAKQVGKTVNNVVEFIGELAPEAKKLGGVVVYFVKGARDAIGKVIWLVGDKTIRPIMNKLDEFAGWIGKLFNSEISKVLDKSGKFIDETLENVDDIAIKASGTNVPNLDIGVVQSRINVANGQTRFTLLRKSGEPVSAGFDHVFEGHFDRPLANSRSIFSTSADNLKQILQSPNVVKAPVIEIAGGQYKRIVDTGEIIGKTALKHGGKPTSWIEIYTDKAGNLITTFPIPKP